MLRPAPRRLPGLAGISRFEALAATACLLVVAAILYPLGSIVLEALGMTGEESLVPDMVEAATSPTGLSTLRQTVILVVPASLGALTIAALLAWLNERTDARLGWLADIMPVLPMFVPPIAGAIGWIFLAAPSAGLLNHWLVSAAGAVGWEISAPLNIFSWPGLIAVYMLYLAPFAYITLAAGFRSVDHATEEAARVGGAGAFQTFRRVTLPSLGPSIGGALLIVVAMGFALFSLPLVIGTTADIDVLSVSILEAMTRTFPADRATALGYSMMLVLLVGGAWLLQRKLSGGTGYATIGGRGMRRTPTELGRWRWVARGGMLTYLALTSVLPVTGLLIVSLQPFWEPRIAWGSLTLDNYREVFGRAVVAESLRNSVLLGIACATIGMLLAALISYLVLRRRTRLGDMVDGVTKLPAAIPQIVLAVAFIVAFAGPPFQLAGTFLILMIAYVVAYFPQASVTATAAFLQVDRQLREAAAISGATQGALFRRVLLPLMLPGLVAGWSFLFVLIAGDINLAAFLAGTRTPVAGFVVLDLFGNGSYPALAALAVVTTALSAIVVTAALRYTRRATRRTTGEVRT